MTANVGESVTPDAPPSGGATLRPTNVIDMQKAALRRLGMIATSPSIFRFWQPIRLAMYPMILKIRGK